MTDIASLVACAHRKCRHLTGGGRCGLLLAGKPILLNARGQCEMMEEIDPDANQDAPFGAYCERHHCTHEAVSVCAICNTTICAHHRSWVPNGAIGPDGELMQTAYCDICTLRHVRHLAGTEVLPPSSEETGRDDYDDPDDPWQPV